MYAVLRRLVVIFGERPAVNGTRRVKSFEAVPTEFVAVTVKGNAPGSVGVPEIVPEESRLRPSGSEPSERVHVMWVAPMAESVAE